MVLNICKGYLGEFSALYCLIKNDYEVLPLTFNQWSSEGYSPGDIIIIDGPQRSFRVQNRPIFLGVTIGDLHDKIEEEEKRRSYKQYVAVEKYFGQVTVDKKSVTLEIYNLNRKHIDTLKANL